jgi:hypothetical protein
MVNKQIKITFTFILLKILEFGSIFGLTFGVYYLGKLFNLIFEKESTGIISDWGYGWLLMLFIGITMGVIFLIIELSIWFIKLNWGWAVILNETVEERKLRESKKPKKDRYLKHFNELGFGEGDYVRIKKYIGDTNSLKEAFDKKKSFKVKKIGWLGTYLEGLDDSYFIPRKDFILVKKGKKDRNQINNESKKK